MTVINGAPRSPTLLGSAYATFVPKPRAATRSVRRVAVAAWLRERAVQIRSITLSAVGVAAPAGAAYIWHLWAGLVATGIASLIMDYAVDLAKVKGGRDVPAG